jgi:hypothetical protein
MLTVEERLPLLIQKRLEAEIQQRPLLFPWETELDDDEISEVEYENLKLISIPTSLAELTSDR